MSEHEIFLARRSYQSRVNHTRFRRKNLHAEKAKRRLDNIRIHFERTGDLEELFIFE